MNEEIFVEDDINTVENYEIVSLQINRTWDTSSGIIKCILTCFVWYFKLFIKNEGNLFRKYYFIQCVLCV